MAQLNTRIALRRGTTADWARTDVENAGANLVLLGGEIGIEILDDGSKKFKVGDGITPWSQLDYANQTAAEIDALIEAAATAAASDATTKAEGALADAKAYTDEVVGAIEFPSGGKVYQVASLDDITSEKENGDIAIVATTFTDGKISRTAYVWDASVNEGAGEWVAFDGNYSAENVFTSKKITLAGEFSTIGNYSKGKVIDPGTSLQAIFGGMFQTTIQPTKTNPSASISASGSDGVKEVGESYTLPTATLTVKTGSYTNEGTATGVTYAIGDVTVAYGADPDTATYTVSNTSVLGNDGTVKIGPSTYSKDATTALFTDDVVSYTFSGKASHSDGNVAKDNLDENSNPEIKITAADLTVADKTASFRGYRKMFVGCTNSDLTSAVIRGLSLKAAQASTTAFEVTAPIGATQLVVATPTKSVGKNYTLSKAEMFTMSYEDYTDKFVTKDSVQVADYRGGENGLQAYNIKAYTFEPLKAATKFRITLKSVNV